MTDIDFTIRIKGSTYSQTYQVLISLNGRDQASVFDIVGGQLKTVEPEEASMWALREHWEALHWAWVSLVPDGLQEWITYWDKETYGELISQPMIELWPDTSEDDT